MSCLLLFFNLCRDLSPVLLPGKSHGRRKEPGRLQSMGSLRVGHDWVTLLFLFTFMHWRRKWQPTPVFVLAWRIPGTWEPGGLPSMGSHSRTRLKRLSSSSIRDLSIYLIFQRTCFCFGWFSFVYFVFSVSWISALIFKLFFFFCSLCI